MTMLVARYIRCDGNGLLCHTWRKARCGILGSGSISIQTDPGQRVLIRRQHEADHLCTFWCCAASRLPILLVSLGMSVPWDTPLGELKTTFPKSYHIVDSFVKKHELLFPDHSESVAASVHAFCKMVHM